MRIITFRCLGGKNITWCACAENDYEEHDKGVVGNKEVLKGFGATEEEAKIDFKTNMIILDSIK